MPHLRRLLLVAPLALLAAGCVLPEEPVAAPASCPVIDTRDWVAFVNAMPGPDARPQLIVTGSADLPSAGYFAELRPGPADRSARPVQIVELVATPPGGPAATVVTTVDLRLEMPAIASAPGAEAAYSGVRVVCAGSELAFIAPVETAW